jgi:hypothetical protein
MHKNLNKVYIVFSGEDTPDGRVNFIRGVFEDKEEAKREADKYLYSNVISSLLNAYMKDKIYTRTDEERLAEK